LDGDGQIGDDVDEIAKTVRMKYSSLQIMAICNFTDTMGKTNDMDGYDRFGAKGMIM
jgi:hypothetical protein